jgi:hypothetical protein
MGLLATLQGKRVTVLIMLVVQGEGDNDFI